jgi:hypothetical protein
MRHCVYTSKVSTVSSWPALRKFEHEKAVTFFTATAAYESGKGLLHLVWFSWGDRRSLAQRCASRLRSPQVRQVHLLGWWLLLAAFGDSRGALGSRPELAAQRSSVLGEHTATARNFVVGHARKHLLDGTVEGGRDALGERALGAREEGLREQSVALVPRGAIGAYLPEHVPDDLVQRTRCELVVIGEVELDFGHLKLPTECVLVVPAPKREHLRMQEASYYKNN